MKTIFKITLILLILIAFQSCNKDDAPTPEIVSQSDPEPTPDPDPLPNPDPLPDPEPTTQNNALQFDGINDYVKLDTLATALSQQSAITVEFWVSATVEDNSEVIRPAMFAINPASPGENKVLIVLGASDTEEQTGQLTIYEQGSPNEILTSEISIADGTCHHVAYVRTQTQVEGFLDGVSMGTFEITVPLETTDRISVGQEWDTDLTSGFFNGTIDDLRIWKVARSANEISTNMNSELTDLPGDLLAYFNFNQGTAAADNTDITHLIDVTDNQFIGELIDIELTGTESNFIAAECTTN